MQVYSALYVAKSISVQLVADDAFFVVEVDESIGGDWEMLSSTYKFTKTAAWAAQFKVPVDKNGTSVLKYRIRVKWQPSVLLIVGQFPIYALYVQ